MHTEVPEALHPKQLVWRCRRGVRELDVIFGRFLETDYPELSGEQKLAFQALLEEQDPLIMDWLFSRTDCTRSDLRDIIVLLKRQAGL